MDNYEYRRLLELKDLISSKQGTSADKKEYMALLYKNGSITKSQYDDFLSGQNTDAIVSAGLTIGAVLLATWLLGKLLD